MEAYSNKILDVVIKLTNSKAKKTLLVLGTGLVLYAIKQKNSKMDISIQINEEDLQKKVLN